MRFIIAWLLDNAVKFSRNTEQFNAVKFHNNAVPAAEAKVFLPPCACSDEVERVYI